MSIRKTTFLGTVDYSYDEVGKRKTMSVGGGPAINYRFDDADRLIEVSQPDLGSVSINYDKAGRRTSLILPNRITTEYNYDGASRLLNMKHSTVSNVIEDLTYTYDAAGNRISSARVNPQAELPKAVTAAYNAANQMLTFNDENLRYDANGNLIEKRDVNGTTTYLWDARNQLTGINGPGLTANFKYDALGRRIEKTSNGNTSQYLYDRSNIIREIENGVMAANYLRSLNIDEIFARGTKDGIRFFQTDSLGSTVALTDPFGAPKTTYTYDPFGNTMTSGEPTDNPFQYTGRENDGTGLYYYRSRYYSPALQRFISEDPIELLGGINYYIYVKNNPIYFRDPYGLRLFVYHFAETFIAAQIIGYNPGTALMWAVESVMTDLEPGATTSSQAKDTNVHGLIGQLEGVVWQTPAQYLQGVSDSIKCSTKQGRYGRGAHTIQDFNSLNHRNQRYNGELTLEHMLGDLSPWETPYNIYKTAEYLWNNAPPSLARQIIGSIFGR